MGINMVFIPRIVFKSGIHPSALSKFPTDGNYTGTQRLLLAQTRIFGTKISGNLRSGIKPFRSVRRARFEGLEHRLDMNNIQTTYPFMKSTEDANYYKLLKQARI